MQPSMRHSGMRQSGDGDLGLVVSRDDSSGDVVDIFAAAGLKNPDISILSDEFLAEIRGLEHKNLAVETLRKLPTRTTRTKKTAWYLQSLAPMGTRKGARRGARRGAVDNTAVDNTAVHFAARFWRRKPCPWVQDFVAKVLNDEIRARSARHLVQSRSFAQMLENSVRRYQNRAVEAAQVIEELIQLARDLRAAARRGEDLGLSDDEVAFYDALEV